MAHNEIQPLADVPTAPVALQHKLCTLKQQRRLGGMFLGSQQVQSPVQVFGDTQIHSHTAMVPNKYHRHREPNVGEPLGSVHCIGLKVPLSALKNVRKQGGSTHRRPFRGSPRQTESLRRECS